MCPRWCQFRRLKRYVYRAVDQYGQIIDVYVSAKRDTNAARRFFATAIRAHGEPVEVVTDRAAPLWVCARGVGAGLEGERLRL